MGTGGMAEVAIVAGHTDEDRVTERSYGGVSQ